ncbi:hypothetical protein CB1_013966006, partial [Camelus ferus]
ADQISGFHIRSVLCVPIWNSNHQIIGVAQVLNRLDGKPFDDADQRLFETDHPVTEKKVTSPLCPTSSPHPEEAKSGEEAHAGPDSRLWPCGMPGEILGYLELSLGTVSLKPVILLLRNPGVWLFTQLDGTSVRSPQVLSYHATCSKAEVDKFKAANIPLVSELAIDDIHFDDFSLDVDAMITAALRMFMELGMVQKFKIDYETLCRWLLTVRKNYRMVLYHNWRHAFNVCQLMFAMLTTAGFQEILTEVEILAVIVGCLCHDLDHRGTNNAFQANEWHHRKSGNPQVIQIPSFPPLKADISAFLWSGSALAQLYGTSATLEHHHFNHAVMILQSEGHNIFANLSSKEYSDLMQLLKQSILATDLTLYFE